MVDFWDALKERTVNSFPIKRYVTKRACPKMSVNKNPMVANITAVRLVLCGIEYCILGFLCV